jgi:predicted alpha/beta hydrolase
MNSFTLTALDGYSLNATHYPAHGARFIAFGSATGVPQGFYRRFAQYAVSQGFDVLTCDYRGIGKSKQGSLKGFQMEYRDWSRYDLAALVQHALQRGPTWIVGHSLGGHALGQMPNVNQLQAAYVCATGAGWSGYMPRFERLKVEGLWRVLAPALARMYGYLPQSKLRMGEDLPLAVYQEWRHWCRFPNYFFDDPQAAHITAAFKNVNIAIAACNSTDDLWALPASRNAFFKHFTGTKVECIDVVPSQLGLKSIGHMGYFREQQGAALWPGIMEWLRAHERGA